MTRRVQLPNDKTGSFAMKYKLKPDPQPGTRRPSELLYVIRPCIDGDCSHLKVELSFKGDSAGETTIKLPSQWAGQKRLYACIKAVQAVSPRTTISDTSEPQTKIVKHPRSRKITIKYEVHQDWSG